MNWFISLLLVVNSLFFTWADYWVPVSPHSKPISLPNVGVIHLLSEMNLADLPSSNQIRSMLVTTEKEVKVKSDVVDEVKQKKDIVQQQLYKEITISEEVPKAFCMSGGQYAEKKRAEDLIKSLPPHIELVAVDLFKHKVVIGYYVMIQALDSEDEIQQMLIKLKQNGVTDTWVFPSGRYKNGISLGLYSQQASAKNYAKELRRKGIYAVSAEKVLLEDKYKVVLSSEKPDSIRKFAAKIPINGIKIVSCP